MPDGDYTHARDCKSLKARRKQTSFRRSFHFSASRGPAFTVSSGSALSVFLVLHETAREQFRSETRPGGQAGAWNPATALSACMEGREQA